jgi:hypothetical protein
MLPRCGIPVALPFETIILCFDDTLTEATHGGGIQLSTG